MSYTRLASPIFTRALARPIVRTTSAIGPFSSSAIGEITTAFLPRRGLAAMSASSKNCRR
jgi:hypothetical protein